MTLGCFKSDDTESDGPDPFARLSRLSSSSRTVNMSQRNIVCGPCGNRRFANREILAHHLKTSSQWHPTCAKCDRRFTSSVAYEAHMSSKHPFRYKCSLCCRDFAENFQLQDHFRGSDVHPNCPRCGKGFADDASLNSHRATSHIKVQCEPCQETVYREDLTVHYTNSTSGKHPKCLVCEMGCKDEAELQEHARTHMEASSTLDAGADVGLLPSSPEGNTDRSHSDSLSLHISSDRASSPAARRFPLLETASPVNPNLGGPPIPSKPLLHANAWGTLANPLIRKDLLGSESSRTDTPPLQLSMAFSSPLMKIAQPGNLYSPATPSLAPPSPEMNRAWSSKENRVSPPRDTAPAPTTLFAKPETEGTWASALSQEKRTPGGLEWRRSGITRSPTQSPGDSADSHLAWAVAPSRPRPLQSRDSSTGAYWLKSRLHSARQPSTPQSANVRNIESSASQSTSTDVVRWRALLGDEDDPSVSVDSNETPRARSPNSAQIKEIGAASDPLSSAFGQGEENSDLERHTDPTNITDLHQVAQLLETKSVHSTTSSQYEEAFGGGESRELESMGYRGRTASENTSPESSSSIDGHDASQMDSPPTTVATSLSSSTAPAPPPLHCRHCKSESCEDITATMCGHIFCYKCITSEVIRTSKCPVCSTPTLLYCLFKLDLSG